MTIDTDQRTRLATRREELTAQYSHRELNEPPPPPAAYTTSLSSAKLADAVSA
jgi:hypothetical protein